MGMIDNIKDKLTDNSDEMRERYENLKSKEQSGELDDAGREELAQLRSRMENTDSMSM